MDQNFAVQVLVCWLLTRERSVSQHVQDRSLAGYPLVGRRLLDPPEACWSLNGEGCAEHQTADTLLPVLPPLEGRLLVFPSLLPRPSVEQALAIQTLADQALAGSPLMARALVDETDFALVVVERKMG